MEFRDYQLEMIKKAKPLLEKDRFVYLAMEVRTGKTLTSLGVSALLPVQNLLFITKKKAIGSIEDDYKMLNPSYKITVVNYESLHKIDQKGWDMVVCDESHGMGAFPKRNKRSTQVKSLILKNNPYVIFLSGTPTPESYSQMYHQVSIMKNHPFKEYTTFYKFAKKYVNITQRKINSFLINDYSCGLDTIISEMKPHTLSYTQKEAGFKVKTTEHVIEVDMLPITYQLAKKLTKNLVIEGKDDVILADTPVKLMMKLHQIYSGTVKFESGNSMVLDYSKAEFIHDNFIDIKIGIFYKFKQELVALQKIYGDQLCTDLETFKSTDKSIALQIVSGREGISLKEAKILVYYNIDFSATSYWQSRDRMTTKDRLENDVYWIFSKGGIEHDIYQSVIKKKNYTLRHFERDLLNLNKI
jgi:hypothetical protein|tara:strand:+ start:2825 stop:4063 length:1239 start_codon:yes stop_codon:yes gene_type:complete